jgi:hypothetical protein
MVWAERLQGHNDASGDMVLTSLKISQMSPSLIAFSWLFGHRWGWGWGREAQLRWNRVNSVLQSGYTTVVLSRVSNI